MEDNIAGGPFGFGTTTSGGAAMGASASTSVSAGLTFDTTGVKEMTREVGALTQAMSSLSGTVAEVFQTIAQGTKQGAQGIAGIIKSLKGSGSSSLDGGTFSTPPTSPSGGPAASGGGGGPSGPVTGASGAPAGTTAPMGTGITFGGSTTTGGGGSGGGGGIRTSLGSGPWGSFGSRGGGETVSIREQMQNSLIGRIARFTGAAIGAGTTYASSYMNAHFTDMIDSDVLFHQLGRQLPQGFVDEDRETGERGSVGFVREILFGGVPGGAPGLASNYYSNTDLTAGIRTMMQNRGYAPPGTDQFASLMTQASGISAMMPNLGFEGAAGLQGLLYSPNFHNQALGLTGSSPLQFGGGTQDPRDWAQGFIQDMFGSQAMSDLGGITEANVLEVFQPGSPAYAQAMAMSGGNIEFVDFLREIGVAMAQNDGEEITNWDDIFGEDTGQGFGVDITQSVRDMRQETNEFHQQFFEVLIPEFEDATERLIGVISGITEGLDGTLLQEGFANFVANMSVTAGVVEELGAPFPGLTSNIANFATGVAGAIAMLTEWFGFRPTASTPAPGDTSSSGNVDSGGVPVAVTNGGDGRGTPPPYTGDSMGGLNHTPDPPGSRGAPTAVPLHNLLHSTGAGHRVTSIVRPGARTRNGGYSYHATGHALDLASPTGGRASYNRDDPGLAAIYRALKPYKDSGRLTELIYGGPSGGGWRTQGTRRDHLDHVHVAASARSLGVTGSTDTSTAPVAEDGSTPTLSRVPFASPTASTGFDYDESAALSGLLTTGAPSVSLLSSNRTIAEAAAAQVTGTYTAHGSVSDGTAKGIGRTLAAAQGWVGAEWEALEQLWTGESGWRVEADNPSSSAYGIPQALLSLHDVPAGYYGSKTGSGANIQAYGGSAQVQIQWGIDYIKGRYGTPSAALAAWRSRSPHWYDGEGTPEPGGSTPAFIGDGGGAGYSATVGMGTPSTAVNIPMARMASTHGVGGAARGGGGSTIVIQQANFTAQFSRATREEAERFAKDVRSFIESQSADAMVGST